MKKRKQAFAELTDRGRAALKAPDGLQPEHILLLEILSRVENATRDNVESLGVQLLDLYGSPEAALTALKSGAIGIEQDGRQ